MSGPTLLALTFAAIGLLLVLILTVRLHAFLALLISSMALGLAAGLPGAKVLKSMQAGFGDALGFIAVVVGLGAIIGRFIEVSGGGQELADWLLRKFGRERAPWAVLIASYLLGLPIFFEVGFIILVPVIWNLGRETKRSLLFFAMPLAAALTTTHALVPPHPAPAAAAQLFGADLGKTILLGVAFGFPMAAVGGLVYGGWIARRVFVPVPEHVSQPVYEAPAGGRPEGPPHVGLVLLALLMPIGFIFAGELAQMAGAGESVAGKVLGFLGHPFTALTAAALYVMVVLGKQRGFSRNQVARLSTECLAPMASLLLIMGGGGSFKQVIVDTGVGKYAGEALAGAYVSPLIVAYIVAACLRVAQGSATVAIITAAGILAPIFKNVPGYSPEMLVMASAAGGTILSHVNDAGFWCVKEYLGMSVQDTLRSWTVMKIVTSFLGFGSMLLVQALFF